ncbi:Putative inner membrane protein [Serinicoccus hydrothermalis]|uniref:Inner membrane protein n=1 Tax=Serinicoccus hydrothermalis TaxID=1758689 RepID=A0A1B1NGC8_9MICO|nr:Putative inner membrane protein [Serinicoccus hydrothermalis]
MALALVAAASCGAVLALQSRVNGTLAEHLGGIPAATISFGSGLVVLTLMLVVPSLRRRAAAVWVAVRSRRLRWWQVLGGTAGGLLVAGQTYAVPLVGVTAFLVAIVGGQSVSALLVDRAGLGPRPARRLRPGRVLAAGLAVLGVAVAAAAPRAGDGTGGAADGSAVVLPLLGVVLIGALTSVQQAFNGVVTVVGGAPLATAWVNFLTGTLTLLLVGGALALTQGVPLRAAGPDLPWWAWIGGVIGIGYIAAAAFAVQHLPVLVFVLVAVTTQLVVGILLDALSPAGATVLSPQVLLGVLLAVLASLWSALARERVPAAPRGGPVAGHR